MTELRALLTALAGALALAAPALPGLGAVVARIVGAALGAAAIAIDSGATVDEVLARIHRVGRIDTRPEDAALDARIAALPSRHGAETFVAGSLAPGVARGDGELEPGPAPLISPGFAPGNVTLQPVADGPLAAPVGAWTEPEGVEG